MSATSIIAASAVFVQLACGTPHGPTAPRPSACPQAEAADAPDERKFNLGKPQLPPSHACLDWPMGGHFRKINSSFMDLHHPFTPGKHDGTDIGAAAGTPVFAPTAGVVEWTRAVAPCQDATVAVRFGEGWSYQAHHLSRVDVADGQSVARGQRLGLSGGEVDAQGSGPWTTGPHLHLSLLHDGAYVDAERYFCP